MIRHGFGAMGTDIELLVEADESPAARSLLAAEAEIQPARAPAVPLPPRLGALAAEPRRDARRGPRPHPRRGARARGAPANRRTVRPDRARRARRRRLRPHVRRRCPATDRRTTSDPPLRGRVRVDIRARAYRARPWGPARPRRDRQGRRRRARMRDPRPGGPVPVKRRRGHSDSRPPRPGPGPSASRPPAGADARARDRRARDLRPGPPPVAAGRRGAPPSHRPGHRPALGDRPHTGHGGGRRCRGGRGPGEEPASWQVASGRSRRQTPQGRPACSSTRAAPYTWEVGSREDRPDLLDSREIERDHGLCAPDHDRPRRPAAQSSPVRDSSEGGHRRRYPSLPQPARARRDRHPRPRARARSGCVDSGPGAPRARPRRLPTALDAVSAWSRAS